MSSSSLCLVILGMHRSGTSALAGCLVRLGVPLPGEKLPPADDNPLGFWETTKLTLIHDLLLNELGRSWDMVAPLPEGWEHTEAFAKARRRLLEWLQAETANLPLWFVKDPRTCRLLPLWTSVWAELGVDPRFIVMIRHPEEVAQSLAARDGMELKQGRALWCVYTGESLERTQGSRRVILTYEKLLADPVGELQNLENRLGFSFPLPVWHAREDILGFLDPKLRHHTRVKKGGNTSKSRLDELYEAAAQGYWPRELALSVWQEYASFLEEEARSHRRRVEQRVLAATKVAPVPFCRVTVPVGKEEGIGAGCFLLFPGEWDRLEIPIFHTEGLRHRALRIDPLNQIGVVRLASLRFLSASEKKELGSFVFPKDIQRVTGGP
ncbi:sulfotransferase family protein, partial [Candidatus Methylacidithermus pantelleriae]|uniref:sulfotransferase family protein n=1 Tax=Candidatus Methylacidithermus pantelleriae TaxID=2744239 RepID=UPI00157DBBCD